MKSTLQIVNRENFTSGGTLLASVLAAVCCIGPAIALVTGASMGFMGVFMVLDPYRPWFLAAGFLMLAYSFFRLYIRKTTCACEADQRTRKISRIIFWSAVFFFLIALSYQRVLFWLYG